MRRLIERSPLLKILCLALATSVLDCSILEAKVDAAGVNTQGQAETTKKLTLKERIQEVSPGAMIEVKLLNKQKVRGRLGEVTDEGFSLTTAQRDKISSQKVAFTDVKSFKKVEGGKTGRTVLYVLAAIGAAYLIWFAAAGPR